MKRILTLVFFTILAINLSNCSGNKTEPIKDISDLKGKVIGMLSSSASPKTIFDLLTKEIGAAPKEVLYFNRGVDLITAVKTGKIDAAPIMEFVADYYIKRNNDLMTLPQKEKKDGVVLMAVRGEDQKLKDELDSAITKLQENGLLKKLEEQWITNLPVNNEPSNTDIRKINGAKTYYIGITGDYAPLDYIAADGKPAGYNVALITEIGKIMNTNFEFVPLEAQAKFPALFSKKIDVVFCQYYNKQIASLFNSQKNKLLLTKPYYTSDGLYFIVKK